MVKTILAFEFNVGGGLSNTNIESPILAEGYLMLSSLIGDLKSSGFKVYTSIDSRLKSACKFKVDKIIPILPGENPLEKLSHFLRDVDGVILIAPAYRKLLFIYTKFFEKAGVEVLGSSSKGIYVASNKLLTFKKFKKHGILTPKTAVCKLDEPAEKVKAKVDKLGYPVIFKPIDGDGCSGISLVKNSRQIKNALKILRMNTVSRYFLIQKFIDGLHASVSFLSSGFNVYPLTLNLQKIKLKPPRGTSSYEGGLTPLYHPLAEKAFLEAKFAVECLEGLKGYIGVDLVISGKNIFIVEVNPRLTTIYAGLSRISKESLANLIVNTSLGLDLNRKFDVKGFAQIFKIPIKNVKPKTFTLTSFKGRRFEAAAYFPPQNLDKNFILTVTWGRNLKMLKNVKEKVKKRILSKFNFKRQKLYPVAS